MTLILSVTIYTLLSIIMYLIIISILNQLFYKYIPDDYCLAPFILVVFTFQNEVTYNEDNLDEFEGWVVFTFQNEVTYNDYCILTYKQIYK